MASSWSGWFDALAEQRYSQLVGFAALMARPQDAYDIANDALIKTFSRARRFDSLDHAEHYVRRAIVTTVIDRERQSQRRRLREERTSKPESYGPGDLDPIVGPLQHALQELPSRTRACVVLRHLEDLSTAQCATVLGISEGAVKRYLSEGMTSIRQFLDLNEEGSVDAPHRISVFDHKGGAK